MIINICYYYTARSLTMNDVDRDFFYAFKKDEENKVKVQDLSNYLIFRYKMAEQIAIDTVNSFDLQNTGTLNEKQYLNLMNLMRANHIYPQDLNNFNAFDPKHQGFIDVFQLFCGLNNMGVPTLYGTAIEMIKKVDKDNDNRINRDEFKNLFK